MKKPRFSRAFVAIYVTQQCEYTTKLLLREISTSPNKWCHFTSQNVKTKADQTASSITIRVINNYTSLDGTTAIHRPACLCRKGCLWDCDPDVSMHKLQNSQSAFLTTSSLIATLTFNPLTSKSTQFISVTKCTYDVNLVKLPQVVCKTSCSQTWSQIPGQPDNRMSLAANFWLRHKNCK